MSRKKIIIILGITILVVSVAGYIIYAVLTKPIDDSSNNNQSQNAANVQDIEQETEDLIFQATSESSNTEERSAATSDLETKAQQETDKTKRSQYNAALIEVYQENGQLDKALDVAKQLENDDSTALSAAVLAGVYRAMGDYENAAKYYGIAADRSEKPSTTTEKSDYTDYKNMQDEMLAQGSA